MNPMGNKVHAIVDGVISRQSTSSLGGISLYPQGVDGNEYYYVTFPVRVGDRPAGQGRRADRLQRPDRQRPVHRPHVHFEVHPGAGTLVNPYPYVKAACG